MGAQKRCDRDLWPQALSGRRAIGVALAAALLTFGTLTTSGPLDGEPAAASSVQSSAGSLSAVACSSASTCLVAGEVGGSPAVVGRTTDDGTRWAFTRVGDSSELTSLACSSASRCWVGGRSSGSGAALLATADGGRRWSSSRLSHGLDVVDAISCATARACVATAERGAKAPVALVSGADGAWTVKSFGGIVVLPYALSCPTAKECVVGGIVEITKSGATVDTLARSVDGASSWTAAASPKSVDLQVSAVSCPSASKCFAAATLEQEDPVVVLASTDGGASWHEVGWKPGDGPVALGRIDALSCPTSTTCYAAGEASDGVSAALWRSSDGGATWKVAALPGGLAMLDAISCTSPVHCMAVGMTKADAPAVVVSVDGDTWHAVHI